MIIFKNKKLFVFVSLFFCLELFTQPIKSITVAPLGLINKVRVKYESQLDENSPLSWGGFFNFYYGFYPGARLDPFLKYYLFSEKLNSFYLIIKPGFGYFKTDLTYQHITNQSDTIEYTRHNYCFFSYGTGFGCGYQLNVINNIILDSFITINFFNFNPPTTQTVDNIKYNLTDQLWMITGPGAFINMHLGIGFKF